MSVSASTLALFVILVPGLIFRFAIYHQSLVKRSFFGSSTIYTSIEVILYSVAIHIALIAILPVFEIICWLLSSRNLPKLEHKDSDLLVVWGDSSLTVTNFVFQHPLMTVWYVSSTVIMTVFLAWGVRFLAKRTKSIGSLLYGPVSQIISRPKTTLLTCFVLTKVGGLDRRLMYQGIPKEISLGEGNSIGHVVLVNPEKFYLILDSNSPKSTKEFASPISSGGNGDSFLYIDGDEIENVHFEGFYFKTPHLESYLPWVRS